MIEALSTCMVTKTMIFLNTFLDADIKRLFMFG